MRKSFIKKSGNAFFQNKRATVLNDISNTAGQTIRKGLPVIITGKNHTDKETLDVYFGEIICYGVNPEDLELQKDSDTMWPIESDTLDLREHEFKFNK